LSHAGHAAVTEKPSNPIFTAGGHQMGVALYQGNARPSPSHLKRQQILVDRPMPTGEGVAAGMRGKIGMEPCRPNGPSPRFLDLATVFTPAVRIGFTIRAAEHRTLTPRQSGQRGDHTRR